MSPGGLGSPTRIHPKRIHPKRIHPKRIHPKRVRDTRATGDTFFGLSVRSRSAEVKE
jgi:hypothetical protein